MAVPSETVLLVDDDALVRMDAADLLEEAGFQVIEAANAQDALRWLEVNPQRVSVLVTDVHMPGSMNGIGLAREVNRRWPHIRLVVTSGRARYTDRDVPDNGRFVPKPWEPSRMIQAIHSAGRS